MVQVCPRCGEEFSCGADEEKPCWCVQVELNEEQREELSRSFKGCLCPRCLAAAASGDCDR